MIQKVDRIRQRQENLHRICMQELYLVSLLAKQLRIRQHELNARAGNNFSRDKTLSRIDSDLGTSIQDLIPAKLPSWLPSSMNSSGWNTSSSVGPFYDNSSDSYSSSDMTNSSYNLSNSINELFKIFGSKYLQLQSNQDIMGRQEKLWNRGSSFTSSSSPSSSSSFTYSSSSPSSSSFISSSSSSSPSSSSPFNTSSSSSSPFYSSSSLSSSSSSPFYSSSSSCPFSSSSSSSYTSLSSLSGMESLINALNHLIIGSSMSSQLAVNGVTGKSNSGSFSDSSADSCSGSINDIHNVQEYIKGQFVEKNTNTKYHNPVDAKAAVMLPLTKEDVVATTETASTPISINKTKLNQHHEYHNTNKWYSKSSKKTKINANIYNTHMGDMYFARNTSIQPTIIENTVQQFNAPIWESAMTGPNGIPMPAGNCLMDQVARAIMQTQQQPDCGNLQYQNGAQWNMMLANQILPLMSSIVSIVKMCVEHSLAPTTDQIVQSDNSPCWQPDDDKTASSLTENVKETNGQAAKCGSWVTKPAHVNKSTFSKPRPRVIAKSKQKNRLNWHVAKRAKAAKQYDAAHYLKLAQEMDSENHMAFTRAVFRGELPFGNDFSPLYTSQDSKDLPYGGLCSIGHRSIFETSHIILDDSFLLDDLSAYLNTLLFEELPFFCSSDDDQTDETNDSQQYKKITLKTYLSWSSLLEDSDYERLAMMRADSWLALQTSLTMNSKKYPSYFQSDDSRDEEAPEQQCSLFKGVKNSKEIALDDLDALISMLLDRHSIKQPCVDQTADKFAYHLLPDKMSNEDDATTDKHAGEGVLNNDKGNDGSDSEEDEDYYYRPKVDYWYLDSDDEDDDDDVYSQDKVNDDYWYYNGNRDNYNANGVYYINNTQDEDYDNFSTVKEAGYSKYGNKKDAMSSCCKDTETKNVCTDLALCHTFSLEGLSKQWKLPGLVISKDYPLASNIFQLQPLKKLYDVPLFVNVGYSDLLKNTVASITVPNPKVCDFFFNRFPLYKAPVLSLPVQNLQPRNTPKHLPQTYSIFDVYLGKWMQTPATTQYTQYPALDTDAIPSLEDITDSDQDSVSDSSYEEPQTELIPPATDDEDFCVVGHSIKSLLVTPTVTIYRIPPVDMLIIIHHSDQPDATF